MRYKNSAGEIELDCNLVLSKDALSVYAYLNKQTFDSSIFINEIFVESVSVIFDIHGFVFAPITTASHTKHKLIENNTVLLAFSGGLDSVYQAFYLREQGYDVLLFHCKNMNYYTNGKEYQVCEDFVIKYNFPIVYTTFKQNTKGDNPFKKYWKENSFKNLLLYSMMVDYCVDNNISNISCGDDLRLDIKDAVVGTNIADAKQVTLPFVENIKEEYNINFIFVDSNVNKAQRIQKLQEYNALDNFYSCVNPGRFNQSNHDRIQNKFNVNIEKYNCGVCRKCAFHTLLRHYFLNENYSEQFINFCWEKICIGADFEFFNPKLPLQNKIQNLISY